MLAKTRAPRNQTLTLTDEDRQRLRPQILSPDAMASVDGQAVAVCDSLKIAKSIPPNSVDLLFLDPPYNLNKNFHGNSFARRDVDSYTAWLDSLLGVFRPLLKQTATVYICGDWHTSTSIFPAASRHLTVRNRITWEREKGRGATTNWKNASEDIWFCTVSDQYYFNVDAVKLRRRVIAPYRTSDGRAKDWVETENGGFRDTHPSNLWTDISIPFWSMPENTDHPTQKSEKLLAKLLLASTRVGDMVFDPFVGSGTTPVVARKLGRRCIGIDINEEYVLWALRRLEMANADASIQGYKDSVFWERNTANMQAQRGEKTLSPRRSADGECVLFSKSGSL